jgi:AcrR family transcriptional regulator
VSARQKILVTAAKLFYERGINSTGIDLIIAEANVAKASLYNNFDSKEHLVSKYLEMLRATFSTRLEAAILSRGKLVEIPFDLLEEIVVEGEFFGCPFTNALTELPESALVRAEVTKYRDEVLNYFADVSSPDTAQKLMLVYDGVFTSCKLDPDRKSVAIARNLARQLTDQVSL